jgi:hypothetical protein
MCGVSPHIAHRASDARLFYSLQGTVGPAGHVPAGPAGAGSGPLPGTFLPTTPFTDSVE